MIQLHITKTGKSFSPKDEYRIFDVETKNFPNLHATNDFLEETYGKAKCLALYRGKRKVGYVICFCNADYSHYQVEKLLQKDLIEFREVKTLAIV